jgi:competence protein ComEA
MRFSVLGCLLGALLCADAVHAHADDTPTPSAAISGSEPGVVNLNTANEAELERLPGVGPTRARAIVALRTRLARFTHVEQLLRVKGIGRATFRKLRPLVALQGATTLK